MGRETLWESAKFCWSAEFWRMAVLWTLQLMYSYFNLWFLESFCPNKCRSYPRCRPTHNNAVAAEAGNRLPVCIITGATSGLGAAAAHALSRQGFFVVLAGRSRDLLSKTMVEIKQKNQEAHVKAFQVDVSSFQSMLKFKNSLQQWLLDSDMHPSIQLLINNAGILATSQRFTAEGHDQMMGTNYIGAFVMTNLLLPLLKESFIPSRVVNVTSFTHRCVSTIETGDEAFFGNCSLIPTSYSCAEIYESTKLCLLLFSYKLHRQLHLVEGSSQVSVMAADPGVVATNIMREIPSHLSVLAFTVLKFLGLLRSPEDGVSSIVDAALAPSEISGAYFFGGRGRVIPSSLLSYDTALAERLWNNSCKLFLPPLASFTKL